MKRKPLVDPPLEHEFGWALYSPVYFRLVSFHKTASHARDGLCTPARCFVAKRIATPA